MTITDGFVVGIRVGVKEAINVGEGVGVVVGIGVFVGITATG